jgi:Putative peptidoglycan binding domain
MRSISASVGVGGRNLAQDTRTVQELLNQAGTRSGLPLIAVDGIVGPKTIGAIRTFQQSRFGWADGRVDPGGPTLEALNASETPTAGRVRCGAGELGGGTAAAATTARLGFVGVATSAAPLTPKGDALTHKTEALLWLGMALTALQTVRNLMQTGLTADLKKLETMVEFQALNTHFHLDRHPNPLKFLSDLGKTYSFMNIAVNGAETNFANDFEADDFANSDPGGFGRRNDKDNPGRMFFCREYLQTGPLTRVVTIVHEAAHYVDAAIDHFASGVPFPNGRPLTGTNGQLHARNYAQLTPDEARQNASSYAGFAIHVAKRQDTRPTITQ